MKTEVRGGIGFWGLLTIVFITLKLTGVIAWSWIWVLSPLWLPFAVVFLFVIVILGVFVREDIRDREYRKKLNG